jgi:histidyl-tRNA synthetase
MELQTAKGVRDFPPEKKIIRNKIIGALKEVFELYGFNPLETPVLERYDILASKYAGGAEILKETFKLKDRGGRELALRYDLTVPMCRFIGMNPNLKIPFKRYQIGEVFRDGPIKFGRYRSFWQCDIDTIGIKNMTADAEIIALAEYAFKRLNINNFIIKINNRKLLNGILIQAGLNKNKIETVILSIDKLDKFGQDYVKNELKAKRINSNLVKRLFNILKNKKLSTLKSLINNNEGKEGINELEQLFNYLKILNVKNFEFDISLARGLSYYTGTVFEVFLFKSEISSAIAAGGRYDKMISQFLGTKREFPAVGISFGLDTIIDALRIKEEKKSVVDLYIIPINTLNKSLRIVQDLRKQGIKADIDLLGRGPSKNLSYANSMGIPYVLFVGEEELRKKKFKLKNMKTGEEELINMKGVIERLGKNIN